MKLIDANILIYAYDASSPSQTGKSAGCRSLSRSPGHGTIRQHAGRSLYLPEMASVKGYQRLCNRRTPATKRDNVSDNTPRASIISIS